MVTPAQGLRFRWAGKGHHSALRDLNLLQQWAAALLFAILLSFGMSSASSAQSDTTGEPHSQAQTITVTGKATIHYVEPEEKRPVAKGVAPQTIGRGVVRYVEPKEPTPSTPATPKCAAPMFPFRGGCACPDGLIQEGATCRTPVVISIDPPTLPDGMEGEKYPRQILNGRGGKAPYVFAADAQKTPPGLSLSSAGVLAGLPKTAGAYRFTVIALDSEGYSGQRDYVVTILKPKLKCSPPMLKRGDRCVCPDGFIQGRAGCEIAPSPPPPPQADASKLHLAVAPAPGTFSAANQRITLIYTFSNMGVMPITSFKITDNKVGDVKCPPGNSGPIGGAVGPGASVSCIGTYTTTDGDVGNDIVATVGAEAVTTSGSVRLPEATTVISFVGKPKLHVAVAPRVKTFTKAGEKLAFTYTITNIGDVAVKSFRLNDPRVSNPVCQPTPNGGALGVGARTTCTASYTTTDEDVAREVTDWKFALSGFGRDPPRGQTPRSVAAGSPNLNCAVALQRERAALKCGGGQNAELAAKCQEAAQRYTDCQKAEKYCGFLEAKTYKKAPGKAGGWQMQDDPAEAWYTGCRNTENQLMVVSSTGDTDDLGRPISPMRACDIFCSDNQGASRCATTNPLTVDEIPLPGKEPTHPASGRKADEIRMCPILITSDPNGGILPPIVPPRQPPSSGSFCWKPGGTGGCPRGYSDCGLGCARGGALRCAGKITDMVVSTIMALPGLGKVAKGIKKACKKGLKKVCQGLAKAANKLAGTLKSGANWVKNAAKSVGRTAKKWARKLCFWCKRSPPRPQPSSIYALKGKPPAVKTKSSPSGSDLFGKAKSLISEAERKRKQLKEWRDRRLKWQELKKYRLGLKEVRAAHSLQQNVDAPADVQVMEFSRKQLNAINTYDPTGFTGLVGAYLYPHCKY